MLRKKRGGEKGERRMKRRSQGKAYIKEGENIAKRSRKKKECEREPNKRKKREKEIEE